MVPLLQMGILSTTKMGKKTQRQNSIHIGFQEASRTYQCLNATEYFTVKMKLHAYGAIPFQMLVV
jgi:hypothetical protein